MIYKLFLLIFLISASFLLSDSYLDIVKDNNFLQVDDIEYLESLLIKPLPAKRVTKEFLMHYFFLSDSISSNILTMIKKKKFKDRSYLKNHKIPYRTVQTLKNYIEFEKTYFRHYIYGRSTFKEDNLSQKSSLNYTLKYKFEKNNILTGVVIQKDSGEKNPLDYSSLFLRMNLKSGKLILGNYKLRIGQGILWASKTTQNMPSNIKSLIKKNRMALPYTSSYENFYLQGVAFEYHLKNYTILPFLSYGYLSASLDENYRIKSFNTSGYHYDPQKRKNVSEKIGGVIVNWKKYGIDVGADVHYQKFNREFSDSLYKSDNLFTGLNYKVDKNAMTLFGETALGGDKIAHINGILWSDGKLSQMISYRYYQKNFPVWHSNPFAEWSQISNENGWYYGVSYKVLSHLELNFYADIYKTPQIKYDVPVSDNLVFFQANWLDKKRAVRFQYRRKGKTKEVDNFLHNAKSNLLKLYFTRYSNNLVFKTYCAFSDTYIREISDYSKGFLTYQQVAYKNRHLNVIIRLTASKSSEIMYAYENNIDGMFQVAQFTDDDLAFFVLIKKKIGNYKLQLKYSNSFEKSGKKQLFFAVSAKL